MNVGTTKRKHPRHRASIAVTIPDTGDVLVTRDISLSGCFFDHQLPESIGSTTRKIHIVSDNSLIEISGAQIIDRGLLGFGFYWSVDTVTATKLGTLLAKASREPSADAKAHFLHFEQSRLFEAVLAISNQKEKGYKFLFALTAAYFVVLSAPLHFITISNVEQAAFYAVTGLWVSVILIYQSLRFMLWLGLAFRQKAMLMHSISANRSWIFANDGSYYSKSVFPLGATYDRSRARGVAETFPLPISDQGSTTIFHFMIQSLFAFGSILFLSILVRTLRQHDAINGGFRLFDAQYFALTYSAASIVLLSWIQFCGNACSHFHQHVWEARRISANRPNPKFRSGALKRDFRWIHYGFISAMYLISFYGLAALVLGFLGPERGGLFYRHLINPAVTTIVLLVFFIGKIAYVGTQIRAQTNREKMAFFQMHPGQRIGTKPEVNFAEKDLDI